MPGGEIEGMEVFHTPEDAAFGAGAEEGAERGPQPAGPSAGLVRKARGRGKRAAAKRAPENEKRGPSTPAKILRGALAGVADTFRGVLPEVLGGTNAAPGHEEEEEEEEEAPRRVATVKTLRKAAKKAAAKGPVKKKGRPSKKQRREESYKRYVFKVLKQIHPDLGISSKAMAVMHAFVSDQFEKITEEAARLTTVGKHKTLTAREVQTAVRLVLPGELAKHAVAEGKKAVGRTVGVKM